MIYLIRVEYKEITLLKVGYAKNIKKRIDQYTTENPLFELLDYREGDRKLENLLHELFKEYRFEKGREWFYYNDFIVENFNYDFKESYVIEKIKKKIDKAKSFSGRLRLYCEFKEKYPEIDFVIDDDFQKYINILGIDRCKELGYKESLLYKELFDLGYFEKLEDDNEKILSNFLNNHFYISHDFREKMKLYCLFSDENKDNPIIIEGLHHRVDPIFLKYYQFYGTSGCSANKFQESYLISGLEESSKDSIIKKEIYKYFSVNDRIAMSEAKNKLSEIYKRLNLTRTAKATDLGEYFRLSKTNVMVDGVPKNGFKLGERLQ